MKKLWMALWALVGLGLGRGYAQQEGFLGEVKMFAGNFAPKGWMFCEGQLLSIATYSPLFTILGTTYGGDGQTTFALPDLRGRVPVGRGQGPGLSNYTLGQASGNETHTLTVAQMPKHSHGVCDKTWNSSTGGTPTGGTSTLYTVGNPAVSLPGPGPRTEFTGANQPVNHLPPSLGINYIICVQGIFPSR